MGEESGLWREGVEDVQVGMLKLVGLEISDVRSCWYCSSGLEGITQKDPGTWMGPRTDPKEHRHQERKAQSSVRGKILGWAQKHSKGMAREAERSDVLSSALWIWYLSGSRTSISCFSDSQTGWDKA